MAEETEVEDVGQEPVTEETTETASEETPSEATETKTLLSDDEGEGADGDKEESKDTAEVPEAYDFTPPEGFEVSEEVQEKLDAEKKKSGRQSILMAELSDTQGRLKECEVAKSKFQHNFDSVSAILTQTETELTDVKQQLAKAERSAAGKTLLRSELGTAQAQLPRL